jgi:hypothetical protein
VGHAEAPALTGRGEAAFHLPHELHCSQRRDPASHLQRDVARKPRREWSARPVRISRIRAALSARTRASSAPARCLTQIEVELPRASSHDRHSDMRV